MFRQIFKFWVTLAVIDSPTLAIQREVAERTNTHIVVDQTMITFGQESVDKTQQLLFQMGDYHINQLIYEE